MTDTAYTLSVDQQARMVQAFFPHGQPAPPWYWDVMLSQGGLRSTMKDMLTFAEVDARANTIARGLRARGVEHGHRVAWWGETTLDAVPLFAALAKLGAVFVPLNPHLSDEERAPVLAKARPHLVLPPGDALLEPDPSIDATTDVVEPALGENDPHVIFFTSRLGVKELGMSRRVNNLQRGGGTEQREY